MTKRFLSLAVGAYSILAGYLIAGSGLDSPTLTHISFFVVVLLMGPPVTLAIASRTSEVPLFLIETLLVVASSELAWRFPARRRLWLTVLVATWIGSGALVVIAYAT